MKLFFKNKKIVSQYSIAALVCALLWLPTLQSCKRTNDETSETGNGIPSTVNVNLAGVEFDEQNQDAVPVAKASTTSNSNVQSPSSNEGQKFYMPFSEGIGIFGSLEPAQNESTQVANKAATGNKAAIVNTPLTSGTHYTILVYNADGSLNHSQVFVVGSGTTALTKKLDGGKSYTFVAVSLNSTADPVITGTTLSAATVTNATNYLMYFKKQMTLSAANTTLDVVLKHQFSQITTKVIVSNQLNDKYINSISNVFIKPQYTSANLKFSDGSLTYNTNITDGAQVIFPGIGANALSVTSSPTNIIGPSTATGTLNIGSISISGGSKSNLLQSNLNITPGHKYNLNLTFAVPCTQEITTNASFSWNYPNSTEGTRTPSQTITAPSADYGFVLNIYTLDNSFNMRINGVALATKELQFQSGVTNLPINVEFLDGKAWGDTGISEIYNITNGTETSPAVRVVISPEGAISMFARKSNADAALYPLRIRANTSTSFNTVTWNKTANNTIVVDQLITGPTSMTGKGVGKKVIPCQL